MYDDLQEPLIQNVGPECRGDNSSLDRWGRSRRKYCNSSYRLGLTGPRGNVTIAAVTWTTADIVAMEQRGLLFFLAG